MLDKLRPYAGVMGAIASIILALAALVGLVYQVNVGTRNDIKDLRQEIQALRQEMYDREERIVGEIRLMREEIQISQEEIRLSQAEVLGILGSHHHEDGSPPVFTIPPPGEPKARPQ